MKIWRELVIIGILALIVVCVPIQSHQLTNVLPANWSDFYPIYQGAEVALHRGNPYSENTTHAIQAHLYGHALNGLPPSHDREAFVYPGYTAVLFIPLTAIPWPVLSLLLTALWPAMIAFSAWAWIEMCAPQLGVKASTIALLLMVTSWPAVWVCQAMQPTVPAFALATGACYLLRFRRDFLAGLLLAAATFKPQLIVLLLPWLLLSAIVQRRWRFVFSFSASASLLFASSFVFLPHWIGQWRKALGIYVSDDKISLFDLLFSRRAVPIEIAALLLVAFLLRKSLRAQTDSPHFVEAGAVLLAFQLCIIPGGSMWFVYNQVLLFPAALLVVTSRPSGGFQKFSCAAANILIELTVLSVPVCATIYLFAGYHPILAFLPFQNIVLPLALFVALASLFYESNKYATVNPSSVISRISRSAMFLPK